MGFLSFISDTLFGTEGAAQAANQQQMQQALSLLGNVPVQQLYELARSQVTSRSGQQIGQGFQRAIGLTGAAGVGAQLQADRSTQQGIGAVRQSLLNRGLSGSSLLEGATAGVRQHGAQTKANISSTVAGEQAGLAAGRGQALAADTRAREALLASLSTGEAGARLGQAGAQAGVLQNFQHQGTPGLLGQLLAAAAGGLGGGLGLGAAGLLL